MNLRLPGEGIVRDFGKVMYTLLYLKWITNKDNVMSQPGWEGSLRENGYTYVYG